MSKLYFIDSENVGDNWIHLLANTSTEDEILVFYTLKSPHMNYKNIVLLKQSPREVEFIECCEGSNALDFQLCTDLGYRICQNADREFVIVSNDNGYEAVVKYWKHRNIAVKRIPGKACASETKQTSVPKPAPKESVLPIVTEETTPEVPVQSIPDPEPSVNPIKAPDQEETALIPAPPQLPAAVQVIEAPSISESMDPRAKEILYIIGKENLQILHEALQQLYGAQKSKTYYNTFKSDSSYNAFIAQHQKLSLDEKLTLYCAIVFDLSDSKPAMPEDFPKYVMDSWRKKKNLNSFRASLMSKYGKDRSNTYYSLIKAHVKILDQIK